MGIIISREKLLAETDRAFLVKRLGKEFWVAKSQIEENEESIMIPEWVIDKAYER